MTNFEKFQRLLEELFQLDQADLDFGIYKIMTAKRKEIVRFLEKDLLPQVKEAFGHYKSADKALLQKQLDKAIEQARGLGVDPETTAKVKELREQMADSSVDVTALENEVFSHLYNFFRRYYHEGDFISLRRYKEGVYAIPYEGEEVKLYWANHDQYYVKSSEYFRDYTFKLTSGGRVHFKLVAASSEQDNKKEAPGKERRFVICAEDPIYEENGELFIRFEYKPNDGKKKQDALNQEAIERVLNAEGFEEWKRELSKLAPTKTNPNRTVLEKHLTQYTARNTFDYFIHKDLGGFLRRELDFYIKNEVMHLDDIEYDTVPRVEQYLSKIKVIRKIAHKIIQFLEQLENFQKKLWLKKKFVVETNYCITLDRVPEELYPEIAANDAQREEWVRLFAIDEIEKSLHDQGYTAPLTPEFLQQQPHLVLNTRHFSRDFKYTLLGHLDGLDNATDGILINGENFQSLNLAANRFGSSVNCIYIDPPYNTKKDIFPYKDGYKHGSWLAMVADRVALAHHLLRQDGVFFCSIDGNEAARLHLLMGEMYGFDHHIGDLVWRNARDNNPTRIATEHEYIACFAKDANSTEPVWKNDFSDAKELLLEQWEQWKAEGLSVDEMQQALRAFIKDNAEVLAEIDRYKFVDEEGIFTGSQSVHNPHPNGYKYDIIHPETGKPMRMPANGYRFPEETMRRDFIDKGRLIYGPDENRIVQIKLYLRDYKDSLRSVIELDGRLGAYALNALFGKGADVFDNPKPPQLMKRLISFGSSSDTLLCDFFAGSGTTVQAAIEVARQANVRMRYIAVEMGEYFDSVLLPRILKVIHSQQWKDGKPVVREGSSQLVKYIRLESYEDALNNLELKRTSQQASLLEQDDDLREQYVLSYMLDVESRGSQSLLNVESFRNPDQYKLRVERNGETQLVNIDLVETFNWLLGLTVKHIDVIRGVRVVEGTNPDGDRTLVLWRNLDETGNNALDEWFKKQDYNTKDQEYDLIYVNGDNNLENLRRGDQTWKVRLIEEEFGRLMFDVQDV